MPFQKGHKSFHTEESKKRISEALKGRKPKNFYEMQKLGREARRGVPLAGKRKIGWKLSEISKQNISQAMKGKLPNNIGLFIEGGKKTRFQKDQNLEEKNPVWKGEKVGYVGLHDWVKRRLGKPDTCEHCDKNGLSGHQIHWANKSGNYKRDLSDWLRLCVKCHKRYDGHQ